MSGESNENTRIGEDPKFCRAKIKSLLRSSDIVFVLDFEDRITQFYAAEPGLLYLPPEDFLGRKAMDVIPSHIKEGIRESFRRCRSGEICRLEYNLMIGEEEKWFRATFVPIFVNGEYRGAIVAMNDVTDKKKLEEAYRTIVENSIQGLIIFQDGSVVFANPAAEEITGYKCEEMTKEKLREIIHPDHREWAWKMAEDRLAGKDVPERFAIKIFRKDGRTIWLECLARVVKYRGRNAILVAFVDVTESKKAEAYLMLYKNIFERDFNGIAIVDESGRYIKQNEAHRLLFGYGDDEIVDMGLEVCFGEEAEKLLADLRGGRISRREMMCTRKDGSRVEVEVGAFPVDLNGRKYYVLIVKDVTEEREMLRKLNESERRYRVIVENVNDVIVTLNREGRIVYISPSAEKVLGYRAEERLGKSVFDNIHPDDVNRVRGIFEEAARTLSSVSLISRYIRGDGRVIWVEISGSPIEINGELQGVLVLRDVTEKIRLQNMMRTINRILKVITREKRMEEMLRRVCEELGEIPGCERVAICIADGIKATPEMEIEDAEREIVMEVRKCRMFRSLEGCKDDEVGYYFPMRVNDEVKGVLAIRFERKLSVEELELLQTLADDIAFAMKSIELEEAKKEAYMQIEENIVNFAILVDGIRNPLTVIRGLAEERIDDEELARKLIEQVDRISELTKKLEKGWTKSEEVREFLRRHM